jgi:hypothetical protein
MQLLDCFQTVMLTFTSVPFVHRYTCTLLLRTRIFEAYGRDEFFPWGDLVSIAAARPHLPIGPHPFLPLQLVPALPPPNAPSRQHVSTPLHLSPVLLHHTISPRPRLHRPLVKRSKRWWSVIARQPISHFVRQTPTMHVSSQAAHFALTEC